MDITAFDLDWTAPTDRHPVDVCACVLPPTDGRLHDISRPATMILLDPGAVPDGETGRIGAAHLAVAMPLRPDRQGCDTSHGEGGRRACAHTGGIQPVCFGQAATRPRI